MEEFKMSVSVKELIKQKKQKRKVKKAITLGGILLVGFFILNYKSIFATRTEMVSSADKMSSYIVAEYKKQGNNADLKLICKEAKRLDDTGLSVVVDSDEIGRNLVIFYKDCEPEPIQIKELVVNK